MAGAIAGMPAASLVTPADVIKTRLQVIFKMLTQNWKTNHSLHQDSPSCDDKICLVKIKGKSNSVQLKVKTSSYCLFLTSNIILISFRVPFHGVFPLQ